MAEDFFPVTLAIDLIAQRRPDSRLVAVVLQPHHRATVIDCTVSVVVNIGNTSLQLMMRPKKLYCATVSGSG